MATDFVTGATVDFSDFTDFTDFWNGTDSGVDGTLTPTTSIEEQFGHDNIILFLRVIIPAIGFLGIFQSIFCMIILSHPFLSSSSSLYLCALSLSDIFFLSCLILLYTTEFWISHGSIDTFLKLQPTIFVRVDPIYSMAKDCVIAFTAVPIFDQLAFVKYPIKSAPHMTKPQAATYATFVFCIIFLAHFLSFFQYDLDTITILGKTTYSICPSEIGTSSGYRFWDRYCHFAIFVVLPMLLLIYAFFTLACDKRAKKKSNEDETIAGGKHFQAGRSSLMLGVMAITAFACLLPAVGLKVVWFIEVDDHAEYTCFHHSTDEPLLGIQKKYFIIYTSLLMAYSSSRFPLYCLCWPSFRQAIAYQVKGNYTKVKTRTLTIVEDDHFKNQDLNEGDKYNVAFLYGKYVHLPKNFEIDEENNTVIDVKRQEAIIAAQGKAKENGMPLQKNGEKPRSIDRHGTKDLRDPWDILGSQPKPTRTQPKAPQKQAIQPPIYRQDPPQNRGYDQPQDHVYNQPQNRGKDQPRNDRNEQPKIHRQDQPQNTGKDQPRNHRNDQPKVHRRDQPQNYGYDQPQIRGKDQPLNDRNDQPKVHRRDQPQTDGYDQPQIRGKDQPRNDRNDQPKVQRRDQPQNYGYDQPQDNVYNQPQTRGKDKPRRYRNEEPQNHKQYQRPNGDPYRERNEQPRPQVYSNPAYTRDGDSEDEVGMWA